MRCYEKLLRRITIRVTEEEETHCTSQGNKSDYIRLLIQKDMNTCEIKHEEVKKDVSSMARNILDNLLGLGT